MEEEIKNPIEDMRRKLVSKCCGSTMRDNDQLGEHWFICNHCNKKCDILQYHEYQILRLKNEPKKA